MKENGFTLKKGRSRQYHTETMMDADDLLQAFQICGLTRNTSFFHFITKTACFSDFFKKIFEKINQNFLTFSFIHGLFR